MNQLDMSGLNIAMGKSGFAAGTTTTLTLGKSIDYMINGKMYTTPTITNVQPSANDGNTGLASRPVAPGMGCIEVACVDKNQAAALILVQGEWVPLTANSAAYTPGQFADIPEFPQIPDNLVPVGYVTIRVGTDYTAGAGYVFGTSGTTAAGAMNSAATAFNNLYQSVGLLPNRPQIA